MRDVSARELERVAAVTDHIEARLDDAIHQAQAAFDPPQAVLDEERDHRDKAKTSSRRENSPASPTAALEPQPAGDHSAKLDDLSDLSARKAATS